MLQVMQKAGYYAYITLIMNNAVTAAVSLVVESRLI